MTNELNNLPFKVNLPQGNKYRDKDTYAHFLTERFKNLTLFTTSFFVLYDADCAGIRFFRGVDLAGYFERFKIRMNKIIQLKVQ